MSKTNAEYAADLRMVADFYEQHPDAPQPWDQMLIFLSSKDAFLKAVLEVSRDGRVEKQIDPPDSSYPRFRVVRKFGDISLVIQIDRSRVCKIVRPAEWECPDSLIEEALRNEPVAVPVAADEEPF